MPNPARRLYKYDQKLGRMVEIKAVAVQKGDAWPIYSTSCEINPDQVSGVQERMTKQGLQCDFRLVTTRDGKHMAGAQPILRDRVHKRDVYEFFGIKDGDATSNRDAVPVHYNG